MKKLSILFFIFLFFNHLNAQSVGINTDGSTPNSDAALHIKSTSKGLVIPSMTTSQRTSISNVSNGLLVYDTSTNSFWYRDNGTWQELLAGDYSPDELTDNDNNTKVQVEEGTDDDAIRFDIDGSERLVFKENPFGELLIDLPNTSTYNTFLGYNAGLADNTSAGFEGRWNTFVGYRAGEANTTGNYNTFLGEGSGTLSTLGDRNLYLGSRAGTGNINGNNNVLLGAFVAEDQTGGSDNTILGYAAGREMTGGNDNVLIGYEAGKRIGSSSHRNIMIGHQAGFQTSGSDQLIIDNTSTTNPLIQGDFDDDELEVNGDFFVNRPASTNIAMQLFFKVNNLDKFSMGYNTSSNYFVIKDEVNNDQVFYIKDGNIGIQRASPTNTLEVNGTASKASAGDWLANSDARLKKNMTDLNAEETLQKMMKLQGITYEWNDNRPDYDRPEGVQYGFTAQNIQEVFPDLVSEDNEGYLQTSYGTYDAMYVEAIRALYQKINDLEAKVEALSQSARVENGED